MVEWAADNQLDRLQSVNVTLVAQNTSDTSVSPSLYTTGGGTVNADSHIACRAHAVPLPCRAAKGLECVFPI
jgi:hypothetical protein